MNTANVTENAAPSVRKLPVPKYSWDGEAPATLAEFFRVNEETLDDDDLGMWRKLVKPLAIGETATMDYGAGGVIEVKRVS